MDSPGRLLLLLSIILIFTAGCTTVLPAPATPAPALPSGDPAGVPPSNSSGTAPGCTNDTCSFLPSVSLTPRESSLSIEASPTLYSPIMSSTPGIGLLPKATGFNASAAVFTWNASYGHFLSWNAPDYIVNQRGATLTGPGEKIYWSFTDRPAPAETPVTITVVAKDKTTGTTRGTASVTLVWKGNYTVTVQENRS